MCKKINAVGVSKGMGKGKNTRRRRVRLRVAELRTRMKERLQGALTRNDELRREYSELEQRLKSLISAYRATPNISPADLVTSLPESRSVDIGTLEPSVDLGFEDVSGPLSALSSDVGDLELDLLRLGVDVSDLLAPPLLQI